MQLRNFCSPEVLRALGCTAESINESVNENLRIATVISWPSRGACEFRVYHDGHTISFKEACDHDFEQVWDRLEEQVCNYLAANGLAAESDNDRTWRWGLGRPIASVKEGAALVEKTLEDGEGGHCVMSDIYEESFFNDLGLEIVEEHYRNDSNEYYYLVRANDEVADIDWLALNPQQRVSALQEAYNFCYGGDYTIRLI